MRAGAALAVVVGVVMIGHLSVVAFRDRDTKARQVQRTVDDATGGTRAAEAGKKEASPPASR